jgi:glycosyltransferase involved in cell wall biosynthesis
MMTGTENPRPFISIIVPAFNAGDVIRLFLAAALEQTYPAEAYEIVIADNGSNDETRAIVEQVGRETGGRVRLVVEPTIRSSYAARNRAIAAARGPLIAFTDADCVPTPTWLEHGARALQAQGRGCVAGRVIFTFQNEAPNAFEYYDAAMHLRQRYYVEHRSFGATANLLVHADVFRHVGLFRSDLLSGGDHEFGLRVRQAGEPLSYAHDAVVMHPARATFGSMLEKAVRLGRAHGNLHALGIFGPRRRCVFRLRPRLRCPSPPDWTGQLSRSARLQVLVVQTLHAWVTTSICLSQTIRSPRRSRASR